MFSNIIFNKVVLSKNIENETNKRIRKKLSNKNVLFFYQLSRTFALCSLARQSLNCVERCFTMLAESPTFLELDCNAVSKVLASSELYVTSEIEVLRTALAWLTYNIKGRRKFANKIISKIRLLLLQDCSDLRRFLNETSSTNGIDECFEVVKETLNKQKNCFQNEKSHINRYCNHTSFDVLVIGGYSWAKEKSTKSVKQIDGRNLKTLKDLPSLLNDRYLAKALYIKGDVYVFGGFKMTQKFLNRPVRSVEKYSHLTNTWNVVAGMHDNRCTVSPCAFMNEVFFFGGSKNEHKTNSSIKFDTKDNEWKKISKINEPKINVACVAHGGNVVVSGGMNNQYIKTRNVDVYDVTRDKFFPMPSMINGKNCHSLVSLKGKLYVVGFQYGGFEMYDNVCKKFVAIKPPLKSIAYTSRCVSIGSRIIIFQEKERDAVCYDVDNDEWFEEVCDVTRDLKSSAFVKAPCF